MLSVNSVNVNDLVAINLGYVARSLVLTSCMARSLTGAIYRDKHGEVLVLLVHDAVERYTQRSPRSDIHVQSHAIMFLP